MELSKEQIKYLDKKVEYYTSQVNQYTQQVQERAKELDNPEFISTNIRWIQEYSTKLNFANKSLDILELLQDVLKREDSDEGQIRFALQRTLDKIADLEDKSQRRSMVDVIQELMLPG